MNKQYVHFKNLLGIEPVVEESPEENIKPIINNLMIPDYVLFTKEEYTEVMNGWKGGKACNFDSIPPVAFKHCELDDGMIEFVN